jgi:hypothetical protein
MDYAVRNTFVCHDILLGVKTKYAYPPAIGGNNAITSPSSSGVFSPDKKWIFLPFLRILTKSLRVGEQKLTQPSISSGKVREKCE